MAEAIIFDIDGTLLDSVDLHARAWQDAFRHFGYEIPFSGIRSQIGKGGDQLLPVFLSPADLKEKGKSIQEYRSSLFKERYLSHVKPFPCVRELFKRIKENRQAVALASSAKGDELKQFEKIARIDDLVEVETSSADANKSKPHPDIFEAALDRLGNHIRRKNVIVVGDSPHDAEAAGRAGLRTVGVRCGGFPEEALREAGCVAIYDSPEDLLRNYEQSPLAKQHPAAS
ncbi:MAG TPA: HAD family hydrolase [Bryobacteraceae bacterium]|jgi:HAD superfamily hydrolase (TIGR01509 family)|nr:HAD family hydrolase [Bryobacteraceae bacterium]